MWAYQQCPFFVFYRLIYAGSKTRKKNARTNNVLFRFFQVDICPAPERPQILGRYKGQAIRGQLDGSPAASPQTRRKRKGPVDN